MFCIMSWEWLACLPKEVQRIWRRKFTYISWLYLANRYFGLLQFALVIPLLTDAFSATECPKIFRWQPVGAMITTLICQFILGARVFVLYSYSNIILGVLGVIWLAEFGFMSATMTKVFPAPSPAPGVAVPCVAIGPEAWLIAFWGIPLGYDAVTFLLTAYKSYEFWRLEVKTPMLTILFRDGLIYFTAIFVMNLVNVILFATMPPTLQAINLPATTMLGIIMSSRLILNIRNPVQKASGHRAVKTTQYNTTAAGGYSDASTTVASYHMHEFNSRDLEAGAKQSVDKATVGSYEPK
ncbi:hypothetical protein PHLGIDRAFT_98513 [Phlebiopsis gigantea 11061_1 CR5-6]|uniref:DUF6533 domain-containing protein n=1 Tax=Phlebiopsis gigantea (strain 11061_1 CR5-6) TaxID=745531 RepID=A0A0C3PW23_PHLG1|nr:hypothetical protein PHLGIDRAFT_98513 [Phlebiopsis gigantea 11061_1 CR5-6]